MRSTHERENATGIERRGSASGACRPMALRPHRGVVARVAGGVIGRCVDQRGCAVWLSGPSRGRCQQAAPHSEGAAGSRGEARNGVDVRALACHVVSFLVAGARGGYVSPSQLNASVFVENIGDTEPRSLAGGVDVG